MDNTDIERAKEHLGKITEDQLHRFEEMKEAQDWIDFSQVNSILNKHKP